MMFQPRGPNFFLSWMMAWKKHRPNTSFLQVTPRTEGGKTVSLELVIYSRVQGSKFKPSCITYCGLQ